MFGKRLFFVFLMHSLNKKNLYHISATCPPTISYDMKKGAKNSVLEGNTFMNFTVNHHPECFLRCLDGCQCLSFNVCGKQCQLNFDSEDEKITKLKKRDDCVYHSMPETQISDLTMIKPPCCVNNPCLNGGTCTHPSMPNKKRRFRCLCPRGSYGELCQIQNPRSCTDWSSTPISGNYTIVDDNNEPFSVFCDFDSEPNYAWTLVMSFSRRYSIPIKDHGLLNNLTVNEGALDWEKYRLGLSKMNGIKKHSSHWRATCGYNLYGFDEQEYVRVNLSVVDFTKYTYIRSNQPTSCQTIEYLRLYNAECHNCHIGFYHDANEVPVIHPTLSFVHGKCLTDMRSGQYACADGSLAASFKQHSCFNPDSKCQQYETSTTQNWFGKSFK